MPQHFWVIHKKVALSLWGNLSQSERDIIANDIDHESQTLQWFEAKVMADATRLFEDGSYYFNQIETFSGWR